MVWAKTPNLTVRSAGTSPRANRTVTLKDIEWADLICVMEQKHKDRIKAAFPKSSQFKKIHVLDIPDDYAYADPELINIIRISTEHLISNALR